jgi:hypothetical protein
MPVIGCPGGRPTFAVGRECPPSDALRVLPGCSLNIEPGRGAPRHYLVTVAMRQGRYRLVLNQRRHSSRATPLAAVARDRYGNGHTIGDGEV